MYSFIHDFAQLKEDLRLLSPERNSQNIDAHVPFSLCFALSTTLQLWPAGRNIWYLATEHSCTCR